MSDHSAYRRYHQILFWPLELAEAGTYDIDVLARRLARDAEWADVVDPLDRGTTDDPANRYAEYVYFHPFVQRFLYERASDRDHLKSFRILRRNGVTAAKVDLNMGRDQARVVVKVERVHLYLFQPRLAMLVVEISAESISREILLALQDQFRRAYSPYFYDAGSSTFGGNCPVSVEWLDEKGQGVGSPSSYGDRNAAIALAEKATSRRPAFSAHWLWLVRPLVPHGSMESGSIGFATLEDDRMPSMCFIEHADPHSISPTDLIRLCFYDGPGDPAVPPYGTDFLAGFEERHLYRRFWQRGSDTFNTLYLCCGYGFVMLVSSHSMPDVLRMHFRHHYFQLGLIAHFHRAALLRFSRRFTEVTLAAPNVDAAVYDSLREVREEFAAFLNSQWFHEVSNQDQGRELFDFWSGHLGNPRLMQDLATEAAAVDRMISSHRAELDRDQDLERNGKLDSLAAENQALTKRIDRLTVIVVWISGLTLFVAAADTELVRTTLGHDWSIGAIFLGAAVLVLGLIQVFVLSRRGK